MNALVITGYGTNSQKETAHTALLAGCDRADIKHFSEIASGECKLLDYQFLIFPGGFLDGDDLGAAQTAAIRWRYLKNEAGQPLLEDLRSFLQRGRLILGICNGFQLLVKMGLLPGLGGLDFERQASLGPNDSGRFEDRWVDLKPNPKCGCIFTRSLPNLYLPVRHGEGKFVATPPILEQLESENLIALQYIDPETGEATQKYPWNPNGSPFAIAGITDKTGHILGLMPHPEAFHHVTNHPGWTRGELNAPGTMLFVNAVRYLRGQ